MIGEIPSIPCPEPISGTAWVYIMQTADQSLYIGQARDLCERVRKHRLGLGSKFTRDHSGPRLVYCEGPLRPEDAIKREAQLKRWSRTKKEALIRGQTDLLRTLSRSRD